MKNIVRTIFSDDGTRKIEVYSRQDGTFGFDELQWTTSENAWISAGSRAESVTSSARAAAVEGLSRADWSRDGGPGISSIGSDLEARRLVERCLDDPEIVILDEATLKKPWGWVFFYQSKRFAETDDLGDALAGNAPLLVNRRTREIIVTGTAESIDSYIERYEEEL